MINDIQIITEFSNDGVVYGVYSAMFKGEKKVFIRSGASIGVVQHLWNEPSSKCVAEIRDDIKQMFLSCLEDGRDTDA